MSSKRKKRVKSEPGDDVRRPRRRTQDEEDESIDGEQIEEEEEVPDFDEDTVISTVASLPLEGKLAYLLSVDSQLREQNDDLDYKSEKSQWKLKQFKKELFQEKHGAELVSLLELNEKLRAEQVELLDTLTTLNSRAIICLDCLHRLEDEVADEFRDPVLDMTDRVRAEAEGAMLPPPGAQNPGTPGASAMPKPVAAGDTADSATPSVGARLIADGVRSMVTTSDDGKQRMLVSIGEGEDRALRGALRDALAQHTHLRAKGPANKPRAFSVATLGRKMFRLKPLLGASGTGVKKGRRVRFIGDDPSLPLIEYTPRLEPGDAEKEMMANRLAAEKNLTGSTPRTDDMGEGPHACPQCNKRYKTELELKAHIKIRHETPYLCSVCGKAYSSELELTTHEKLRHSATPFNCAVCKNSYATKLQLISHVELRHPEADANAMVAEIQRLAAAGTLARRPRAVTSEAANRMGANVNGSSGPPPPAAAAAGSSNLVSRFVDKQSGAVQKRRRGSTTSIMPDNLAAERDAVAAERAHRRSVEAPAAVTVTPAPGQPGFVPPPPPADDPAATSGSRGRSASSSAKRRSVNLSEPAGNAAGVGAFSSGDHPRRSRSSSTTFLAPTEGQAPARRSRRNTDNNPPRVESPGPSIGGTSGSRLASLAEEGDSGRGRSGSDARRQRRLSQNYGESPVSSATDKFSRDQRKQRRRSMEVRSGSVEEPDRSSSPGPPPAPSSGATLKVPGTTSRSDKRRSWSASTSAAHVSSSPAKLSADHEAASSTTATRGEKSPKTTSPRDRSTGEHKSSKTPKSSSSGSGLARGVSVDSNPATSSLLKGESFNKKEKKKASKDSKDKEAQRAAKKEKKERREKEKAAAAAAAAASGTGGDPKSGLTPPPPPPEEPHSKSPRLPPRVPGE